MPRPYSTDLRERALRACERGRVTRARIAALFGVGETTLYRWQQQTRIDGRRKAKPARAAPRPGWIASLWTSCAPLWRRRTR